jgi:uncharacterized protein (TIGR03067 family)
MIARCLLFLCWVFMMAGQSMAQSDLEGAWTATAAERDGAAAPELVGNRIEFMGDRFSIAKAGAVLIAGRVTVAPQAVPAAIDFAIEEGAAKGQIWLGIFKIENETLTICDNAPDAKAKRPSSFAAPKGSGHVCLQFRR